MQTRRIGTVDVSAIGLGEMPMSVTGRKSEDESIQTIHAALDAGVNLIDTADAYCLNDSEFGHGEELVAKALKSYGDGATGVLVATKGGHTRTASGDWTVDSSAELPALGLRGQPAPARRRRDRSLPAPPPRPEGPLRGRDRHRQGALRRRQGQDGRHLERHRRPDQGRAGDPRRRPGQRAEPVRAELPVARRTSSSTPPRRDSPSCRGARSAASARPATSGRPTPRSPTVAKDHDVSPQQVALAWELAKAPQVIPIPGSSRPATIADSVKAVELTLSADELASLDG